MLKSPIANGMQTSYNTRKEEKKVASMKEVMLAVQNGSYVAARQRGIFNLSSYFATATYQLTPTELKAWFLVVATINGDSSKPYVTDAIKFADDLGIDRRKARGKIIYEIFRTLSRQEISILSREVNSKGEHSWYQSHFLNEVYYDAGAHLLAFSFPNMLHDYLFDLKKDLTLSLEISDILGLKTVTAIRIFVYLRELNRIGVRSISIETFRHNINFCPTAPFGQYKRRVTIPAEKEIRKCTQFHDFFIKDDGKSGRKATMIYFGFENEQNSDVILLDVKPKLRKEIKKKFSKNIQYLFDLAVQKGFDPSYIKDKFDSFDEERIKANFALVFKRISDDKNCGKEKTPMEYGRYFIRAVVDDWAKSDKDRLAKSMNTTIAARKTAASIQDVNDAEQFQHLSDRTREYAKDYVSSLSFHDFVKFIASNKKEIELLASKGKPFDAQRALTRKKTYREYRLLVQLVAGKMLAGQIPMPKPKLQSLF